MLTPLRDYREPRDWRRPWADPPGFFPGTDGACCAASANMYSAGGHTGSLSTNGSVITDRTVFSTDITTAITGANLTTGRGQAGPVGNPSVAGYYAGGTTGTNFATADKLTFSSETTAAATTANITTNRTYPAGISERSTKGYFMGGSTSTGSLGSVLTSDKLTFSSDTTAAATTANISAKRYGTSGMSEGTTKGYVGGGLTSGVYVATSDKITFSTDTTAASTASDLATARMDYSSMSDGSTKGYWAGGQTGFPAGVTDKVTFSTDVCSAATSVNVATYNSAGSSNGTQGYTIGGSDSITGTIKYANKYTFSTDVIVTQGSGCDLSVARFRVAGLSTAAL